MDTDLVIIMLAVFTMDILLLIISCFFHYHSINNKLLKFLKDIVLVIIILAVFIMDTGLSIINSLFHNNSINNY